MRIILTLYTVFTFYTPFHSFGKGASLYQEDATFNNIKICIDSLGADTSSVLNIYESTILDSLFKEKSGTISLKNKRVLFLSGGSGTTVMSKQEYFSYIKHCIKDSIKQNIEPLVILSEKTAQKVGYDVVVTHWVKKRITERHVKCLFKKRRTLYDMLMFLLDK